jgi:hypothetical protein
MFDEQRACGVRLQWVDGGHGSAVPLPLRA